MSVRHLLATATAHGIVLTLDADDKPVVRSVTGEPVPAAVRAELQRHRDVLTAHLRFREMAVALILDAYRDADGCPSPGAKYMKAIEDAYWSSDTEALATALEEYVSAAKAATRKENRC
jgi:hypothetical protein